MLLNITYLIIGLTLLVGGGHYLVNAGVSAAYKFKISPFIVGATVVAFGTSAPELLVSLKAAVSGHPEMALGNVVGSNIVNIAMVLGITSCLITLPVLSQRLFKDWLLVILSSVLLIVFSCNNRISHIEGGVLFLILMIYLYTAIKSPKEEPKEQNLTYSSWWFIALIFILSGVALAAGAHFLVEGAKNIARMLQISERVISITIVAFGTSLPELVTSIVAALKKQTEISVGNIIGSNLFNILAVIGITAIFKPLNIDFYHFSYDLYLMLLIAFLLMLLIYPYRQNYKDFRASKSLKAFAHISKGKLTIIGGIILLAFYAFYFNSLFL